MKSTVYKLMAGLVTAGTLSVGQAADIGASSGGGALGTVVGGEVRLAELVHASCVRRITGPEWAQEIKFYPTLMKLFEAHKKFYGAVATDLNKLRICITDQDILKTNPALKDQAGVTVYYSDPDKHVQVAVRTDDFVYINKKNYEKMPASDLPFVGLHEVLHSFFPPGPADRIDRLRGLNEELYKLNQQAKVEQHEVENWLEYFKALVFTRSGTEYELRYMSVPAHIACTALNARQPGLALQMVGHGARADSFCLNSSSNLHAYLLTAVMSELEGAALDPFAKAGLFKVNPAFADPPPVMSLTFTPAETFAIMYINSGTSSSKDKLLRVLKEGAGGLATPWPEPYGVPLRKTIRSPILALTAALLQPEDTALLQRTQEVLDIFIGQSLSQEQLASACSYLKETTQSRMNFPRFIYENMRQKGACQ